MQQELFGYKIEFVSKERGKLAYLLHGPKVSYRLMRRVESDTMYALNSHFNICNIRGNYNFADDQGKGLRPIY